MRFTTLLLLFVFISSVKSQDKYMAKDGHVDFYSHAPLEDIEANNDQVAAFFDLKTGDISFAILMKSFRFEKALMQEHFNENYIESDQYPKSSFKAKIMDFEELDLSKDGTYSVIVKGDFTLHGVTKEIEVEGNIAKKGSSLAIKASFIAKPEDYNIKIPKAVRENIAKEITVNVKVVLKPY